MCRNHLVIVEQRQAAVIAEDGSAGMWYNAPDGVSVLTGNKPGNVTMWKLYPFIEKTWGADEPENDIEEGISVEEEQQESTGPTGAAIFAGLMGKLKPMSGLIALVIIAILGIGSYAYFRRPSSELTEEEMERLHKMMEEMYRKSKEEQDRIN